MHFEFLVEGQTELTALSILMEKILGCYNKPHTWKIHKHRGIGQIPDCPTTTPNCRNQTLLHNLPSKLRAYGNEGREDLIVVVLMDLDDRPDCRLFKRTLIKLLEFCPKKPKVLFRIAIEELEAWFLGDQEAIKFAYPDAIEDTLNSYEQDSQCGTWEILAEALYPGGLKKLEENGRRSVRINKQKTIWAKKISPYLNVQRNKSHSFKVFCDGLTRMAESP